MEQSVRLSPLRPTSTCWQEMALKSSQNGVIPSGHTGFHMKKTIFINITKIYDTKMKIITL